MKSEVRVPHHLPVVNNFIAREPITLSQSALNDVHAKEEVRQADLVDYALLDSQVEFKNISFGKPNKPRNLEPNMYDLLTGGYVSKQDEFEHTHKGKIGQQPQELTEEELKLQYEAMLRKEIAKGKWMTETRDNFRRFTDSPSKGSYYIGNNLFMPKRLANIYENHYLSSYKRDYGEGNPEDELEEVEIEEEAIPVEQPKPSKSKNKRRSLSPGSRSRSKTPSKVSERKPTPKKKKLDIKRWVFERNKAKYGKPLVDKSKLSKAEREELEKLEKAITMSRWNPDTHLASMHGKPIWHAYGNKNTDPTVGGIVYGHYLLTHNINPHAGDNRPLYQQVYDSASNSYFKNGKPEIKITKPLPESPKVSPEVLEDLRTRNPIMPGPSSKNLKRHVKQLDLLQEPCFASKHSTTFATELTEVNTHDIRSTPGSKRISTRAASAKPKVATTEVNKKLDFSSNQNKKEKANSKSKAAAALAKSTVTTTPVEVPLQELPIINMNNKMGGESGKMIGPNTFISDGNIKTMASTGLMNKENMTSTQAQPVRQAYKLSGPILHDIDEEVQDETQVAGADQEREELDGNQNTEISPTVFPSGFPF